VCRIILHATEQEDTYAFGKVRHAHTLCVCVCVCVPGDMWNKSVARRVNYKITSRHAQISSFRLSLFSLLYIIFHLSFFSSFWSNRCVTFTNADSRHHHQRNFEASAHSHKSFLGIFFFLFRSDAVVVAWVINCRSSVGKSVDSCARSYHPKTQKREKKTLKCPASGFHFQFGRAIFFRLSCNPNKTRDIYLYPSGQHLSRKLWRFVCLCVCKTLYRVNVFFFFFIIVVDLLLFWWHADRNKVEREYDTLYVHAGATFSVFSLALLFFLFYFVYIWPGRHRHLGDSNRLKWSVCPIHERPAITRSCSAHLLPLSTIFLFSSLC
jgi:hypothetical protein